MERIRISGKNLGALALTSFCPRCFWLRMHCGDKLPYQIFPGIFSSIDSFSKRVTNVYYEKLGVVPEWLQEFGDLTKPVKSPHHSHFFVVDPETNIHLTGVPDEVFQRTDGSYFIADYKTARFTDHQDRLLPLYEVQLNSYAYIGNRSELDPVSGIGLVYYEPQTELDTEGLDEVVTKDGFRMPFAGKLLELQLQPDKIIPPLLRKVRQIYDKAVPDKARSCVDCERLDTLIKLVK